MTTDRTSVLRLIAAHIRSRVRNECVRQPGPIGSLHAHSQPTAERTNSMTPAIPLPLLLDWPREPRPQECRCPPLIHDEIGHPIRSPVVRILDARGADGKPGHQRPLTCALTSLAVVNSQRVPWLAVAIARWMSRTNCDQPLRRVRPQAVNWLPGMSTTASEARVTAT